MFIYCTTADRGRQKRGFSILHPGGTDGACSPTISTFDLPRLFFSICSRTHAKNPKRQPGSRARLAGRQICNKFSFKTRTQISPIRSAMEKAEKGQGEMAKRGKAGEAGEAKPRQTVIEWGSKTYNKGWHNNKKFKMCKKHKKKIHLRQICGFHLNLFMRLNFLPQAPPLHSDNNVCENRCTYWVGTHFPHFPSKAKSYATPSSFFYWFCGQKTPARRKGFIFSTRRSQR